MKNIEVNNAGIATMEPQSDPHKKSQLIFVL
jgi:hypothetical protein